MFHSQKFSPNTYFPPALLHLTMGGFLLNMEFSAVDFLADFCRMGCVIWCFIQMNWSDPHSSAALHIEQLFIFEPCGSAAGAS